MLRAWVPCTSRAFSTAAAAATCPVRPAGGRPTPAPTANPASSTHPFEEIPSPPANGPYGTFMDFQTRVAKTDMRQAVKSYYDEYGPIVRHNMAGQDEVWCFDPTEYLKVMSKQGKYPHTIAVELNFTTEYNNTRNRQPLLEGRDETWKKQRTMLQKDLFNPPDAVSYVKSLDPAVKEISKAAPKFERLSQMTSLAAMDMFCSVMLGFLPNCTAGEVGLAKCDPSDRAFVTAATTAMELIGEFNLDPVARQNVTASPKYGLFVTALDDVLRLAAERIQKLGSGSRLNEVSPYMERLLARGEVGPELASSAVQILLFAGVDTTHHVLQWLLLNLARNSRVQEKLHEEVKAVVGKGPLEVEHLTHLPYLTKILRENNRCTPPAPGSILRKLEEDVDLCGYLVPANTRLMLMSDPIQNDPNIVGDDVQEFRPERWNDEEVAKRKGTPRQILDHQLIAKPFGYGARMCLGARVAELELKTLLVRMVTDWKFTVADPNEGYKTVMGLMLKPDPFPKVKFEART